MERTKGKRSNGLRKGSEYAHIQADLPGDGGRASALSISTRCGLGSLPHHHQGISRTVSLEVPSMLGPRSPLKPDTLFLPSTSSPLHQSMAKPSSQTPAVTVLKKPFQPLPVYLAILTLPSALRYNHPISCGCVCLLRAS